MARRQNAERFLNAELEDLILHGRQTIPPWPDGQGWEYAKVDYDDPVNSLGSGGSQNWPFDALACRVIVGFKERRFKPQKVAVDYLKTSKLRFMGSEQDSLIYAWMHGNAALGCHAGGNEEVKGLAMDWLKQLAARCLLFYSAQAKRVLVAGERSAGELPPPEASWHDTYLHAAMRWGSIPRYEKVLRHCQRVIEQAGKDLREDVPPQLILLELGFQTMNPVRVVEWAGGKAVFVPGQAVNGNTQSVKAACLIDSHQKWLPPDRGYVGGGDRRHRRPGRATLVEIEMSDRTILSYDCEVYGHHTLLIPKPSERTLDLEIGGPEIVRSLLSPVSARSMAPAPQRSWLADLLGRFL